MTHNSAHARDGNPSRRAPSRRDSAVKPRAILWDLFGDHLRYIDDGRVPMRVLTRLLDVFGVGESTSRVVLSRMRREGWFTTYRDGRQTSYALTARSIQMLDEGRARIFDRGRDDWDGTWRMVIYAVPEESRAERDRVRRTLAWHGFGPLAAATWISPHPRLDTVRERARRPVRHPHGPAGKPVTEPRRGPRDGVPLLGPGGPGPGLHRADQPPTSSCPPRPNWPRSPAPSALRRQVELVASYRALPFRDPDLPAALLPEGWQGRRAHALFTAAHDALHGPADAFVRDIVLETHR